VFSTRTEKLAFVFVMVVAGVVGWTQLNRDVGDPIIVGAMVLAFSAIAIAERRSRRNSASRLGSR
jgi:hypothetical protein